MFDLKNKEVLVVGLSGRGQAACNLLRRMGAKVFALDYSDSEQAREAAKRLKVDGIHCEINASKAPEKDFALAVVSPEVPVESPVIMALAGRKIPIIGELELGFQQSRCLSIAVGGTNGKGTTAELVEKILLNSNRKTIRCGHAARPVCSAVDETKELDFLVLQVNAFQLEQTRFFRPAVAVLTNLAPDDMDRFASWQDYARANARLFSNQQAFDWSIVKTETLAQLKHIGLAPTSKVITFSAEDQESDLYLDRGLIISRLPNWSGPLLDTDQCRLRGLHNTENMMAALAVGHTLHLPLESMARALKEQTGGAHCFEIVAEVDGVRFINDSKATNLEALRCALLSTRAGEGGKPNVWLIAGGQQNEFDFHALGPVISSRVKGVFLIGEAREKIRSAWSLFTPCTLADSLLEAVNEAAKNASVGDVILFSPACSSFDQFQNYQQRGERFCLAVKSISGGGRLATPNMAGKSATN